MIYYIKKGESTDYQEIKKNLSKCQGLNKVRNHLPINTNESLAHLHKKLDVAYNLIKNGSVLICEARFKGGGRADIYCLDTDVAYEILCSEKEANILNKAKVYPVKEIKMVKV